jgi:hypothetical protein
MKKFILPVCTVILCSCILYGSGIKTLTGTLSGGLLTANVKVGLFADGITFLYDNLTPGDPDKIDREENDGNTGTYTPVVLGTLLTATSYTITFPDDPSTVKSLVAWDDADLDGVFDLDGSEIAYFPVKTINSVNSVITHFTYIDITEVITYQAVFHNIDPLAADFNTLHSDNFDAIGAGDFNFNFD